MNTHTFSPVLEGAQIRYAQLKEQGFCISIADLINGDGPKIEEYCTSFTAHPYQDALAASAKQFAKDYGIWLEQGKHYITCVLALFPDAPLYRIIPIVENCAIDFYLNDLYGRDVFHLLSELIQLKALRLMARLSKANPKYKLSRFATPVERANMSVLKKLQDGSKGDWFPRFLKLYNLHIEMAHQDCDLSLKNKVPSIEKYCEDRNHISGMPHTIMFIEFSTGNFLNWEWLKQVGLSDDVKALHESTELFGCLSNDLYSFEKECIDHGTSSNLVTVTAFNNPDWSLEQCIAYAGNIVGAQFQKALQLLKTIKSKLALETNQGEIEILLSHLQGIERCIQASWAWQFHSKRYKRPGSIFKETAIREVVTAA